MDLATLGIAIDPANQVKKATGDLKEYAQASEKADAAATKLAADVKQVAGAAEAEARSLAGATRAVNDNARASQVQGSAMRLSNQQLQQMSFQLNDLGVQLASGASPFMAITQQGAQIVQALGPGTGVLGAMKAVGSGIVSFVTNPLNIALVGFAAAAAGASALWGAVSNSGGAERALQSQEDLIKRIEAAYGDATEAALSYAAESQAALSFDAAANVDAQLEQFRSQQEQLARDLAVMAQSFTDAFSGRVVPGFEKLNEVTSRLIDDLADGQTDLRTFNDEMSRLGQTENAGSAVRTAADAISTLIERVMSFEKTWRQAQGLQTLVGGNTARMAENASMDAYREAVRTGEMMSPDAWRASREALAARKAEEEAAKLATQAGREAANEAQRERQAVTDLIAALEFQNGLYAQSAEARDVLTALQRAGAAATDEEAAAIVRLTQEHRALEEAERLREKQEKEAIARMDAIRGTSRDVLSTFTQAVRSGEGFFNSLTASAARLELKLLDLAQSKFIDLLISLIFGGMGSSAGGLLGGLLGGGTQLVGAGLFHGGGRVGDPGPMRIMAASHFDNAPRFAEGLRARAPGINEVPVLAHRGEVIGWPDQMRQAFGGKTQVTVNNYGGNEVGVRDTPDGLEINIALEKKAERRARQAALPSRRISR